MFVLLFAVARSTAFFCCNISKNALFVRLNTANVACIFLVTNIFASFFAFFLFFAVFF